MNRIKERKERIQMEWDLAKIVKTTNPEISGQEKERAREHYANLTEGRGSYEEIREFIDKIKYG